MKARKVDEYFDTAHETYQNLLEYIMYNATLYGNTPLFNQVYIPVKRYDTNTQKLADGYTYMNCGMSTSELADLYWAKYSGTYLIGRTSVLTDDADKLILRAKAVFNENRGKYLKLIELAGLEWNPLWNVDGSEIRQLLENSGTTDVETGQINTTAGVQWNDTKTTHNVSAYNTSEVKKEYEDTVSGNGANIPTGIQRVEYTDGEFTVSNQSPSDSTIASADESTNGVKGKTKYVHNLAKNIINGEEADYVVLAKDTAFGQSLTGADKMHVEKLIRQGNIGVTKTTELIEDARKTFAYSIIQEFFNDINEAILVGVYGIVDDVPWWYYQSSGS